MKRGNYLFVDQKDQEVIIRMTPELQDDIGTVGYVSFTEEDMVSVNDALANVEASKTVMEILSPVSGKIIARNEVAISEPHLLNSANEAENWVVKLTDVDQATIDALEEA